MKSPGATFVLEFSKFSQDSIQTTLVCSKCAGVFQKEFPIALEGLTSQFKCPVCNTMGEADLPYKEGEEPEKLQEDLEEPEGEEEEVEAQGSSGSSS